MSWTDSHDFATGEFMLSALLQTYVHDLLIETAPAKALAAGDQFYADAPNHLKRLPVAAGDAGKGLRIGSDGISLEWGGRPFRQAPVGTSGAGNLPSSATDLLSQNITVEAGTTVIVLGALYTHESKSATPGGEVEHHGIIRRDSTDLVDEKLQGAPYTGAWTVIWPIVFANVHPGAATYTYSIRGYYVPAGTTGTPVYQATIMLWEI